MLEQLALLHKSLDPSLAGTLAGLALAASIFCYGVNQFSGKSLKLIGDGFLTCFLVTATFRGSRRVRVSFGREINRRLY